MCLTCTCEKFPCPQKQLENNNLVKLPPVAKQPIMSGSIPSPISPELAEDCLDPDTFHSLAIDVPEAHERDVNLNPLSAHQHLPVDKCEGMLIGSSDDKVKILEQINRGSFGRVYRGLKLNTGETVAVKVEDQGTGHEKIMNEGNICRKMDGCIGIPEVFWYGMHGSEYNFLVMEFLGPNLLELFEICNYQFSLQTVLKIASGILPIMQYLHEQNIMHRDISPRNLVIGVGPKKDQMYLIDFGLAKRCTRQGQMLLPSPTRFGAYCNPLVGTPRFASINCHRGGAVGRSDDLESLGYVLVYLLKGSLPWQEEHGDNIIDGIRYIEHTKVITPVEVLCEGIPDEFATLISYARLLKYYEMPDYKSITTLFGHLIKAAKIDLTACFDWDRNGELEGTSTATLLKRNRSSLPQISSGSDESIMVPFACSMCKTNTHFTCNSN